MKQLLLLILPALAGCSIVVDVDRFNSGGAPLADAAGDGVVVEDARDAEVATDTNTPETPLSRRPQVFIAGGNVGGVNEKSVLRGEISTDGTIPAWMSAPDLPVSSTATQATRSGANVFILGPDFVTTDAATVRFAKFDSDGKLSSWSGQKTLTPRGRLAAASSAKFVYAIGGMDGGAASPDVFVASINSDGSPGAFAAARPLAPPRFGACAVVVDDNLYVMGGVSDTMADLDTVVRAPIGVDGALGEWLPQPKLNLVTSGCSAVAVGRRIFVVGGYGAQDSVQHAIIGTSGDVNPWTTGAKMTSQHAYFQAVVAGGYIVAAGGFSGGSTSSVKVDIAPITESGIGTWKSTTELPKPRHFVNAFGFD
jgi:hypothetical protein